MTKKVYAFLQQALLILTLVILGYLGITSLLSQAYLPMDYTETISFHWHAWYFYPIFALALYLLYQANKRLAKLDGKSIFIFGSLLYLLLGIYLIVFVEGEIRADAGIVYQLAKDFKAGDFSALATGGYLYNHPHQIGLLTLDQVYLAFFDDTKMAFFLNLLMVLGINGLIYKISQQLTSNHPANKLSLALTFLFFPQFFFILFVYGTIPGLLASLSGFYLLIRYRETEKINQLIYGALLIGLACAIRNNYQIFVITLILSFGLDLIKHARKKNLWISGAILLSMLCFNRLSSTYYSSLTGAPVPKGIPMISYVTMGLSESDRANNPGWWTGYNTDILQNNDFNYDKATQQAKADLQARLNTFSDSPQVALDFFVRKTRSTWTEPTFQSIWTGPLPDLGQETYTPSLKSLYETGLLYQIFHAFGGLLLPLIYLLNVVYLAYKLFKERTFNSPLEFYPFIFFLGGFFFHLMWETKSQYVYIFVLLLIPTAAQGLSLLFKNWEQRPELPEWTQLKQIIRRDLYRYRYVLVALVAFVLLFILNRLTLYTSDDLRYAYFYDLDFEYPLPTTHRINGLGELIQSQINHYLVWNGRFVAHTLVQFFMQYDKWLFDIFNSLAFIALAVIMMAAIKKLTAIRLSASQMIYLLLLLWWFLPNLGLSYFWLSGSFNYLWTALIYTGFLVYNLTPIPINWRTILLVPVFSFLAGATNENSGPAALLFIGCQFLINWWQEKRPNWLQAVGILFGLLGFYTMIASPGSQARSGELSLDMALITTNLTRIWEYSSQHYWPLYLLLLVLVFQITDQQLISKTQFWQYLALGLAHVASMLSLIVLREYLSDRLFFGSTIFLIILVLSLYNQLNHAKLLGNWRPYLYPLLVLFTLHFSVVYEDLASHYQQVSEQYRIIQTSKEKHVKVPFYGYARTDYNAYNNSANLSPDPEYWYNRWIAFYFGKERVTGVFPEEYNEND